MGRGRPWRPEHTDAIGRNRGGDVQNRRLLPGVLAPYQEEARQRIGDLRVRDEFEFSGAFKKAANKKMNEVTACYFAVLKSMANI